MSRLARCHRPTSPTSPGSLRSRSQVFSGLGSRSRSAPPPPGAPQSKGRSMRKFSFLCAVLLLTWTVGDASAGGYHGGYYGHFRGNGFYNRGYGYPYALNPSAFAAFQVVPSVRTVYYDVPTPV